MTANAIFSPLFNLEYILFTDKLVYVCLCACVYDTVEHKCPMPLCLLIYPPSASV